MPRDQTEEKDKRNSRTQLLCCSCGSRSWEKSTPILPFTTEAGTITFLSQILYHPGHHTFQEHSTGNQKKSSLCCSLYHFKGYIIVCIMDVTIEPQSSCQFLLKCVYQDFYQDCIESIDQFGRIGILTIQSLPNNEDGTSFYLFMSPLIF